jgi:hypothetical protein
LVAYGVAASFAAGIGVSTGSGMQLMSDALRIYHLLPRLCGQVEDLVLPVWKARKVAQATALLSVEACAFVDEQLAARARGFAQPTIDRLTAIAIAAFHPDLHAEKEAAARDQRHVTVRHPGPADPDRTSYLTGYADPLDLAHFDQFLSQVATALGRLGDTDPFRIRRSKALGVIADQDQLIDVLTRAEDLPNDEPDTTSEDAGADQDSDQAAPKPKRKRPRRSAALLLRKPATIKFNLHFSAADLAAVSAETGEEYVLGEVERLGPATLQAIRDWLDSPGATITPVIDLNRTEARNPHDPPPWMRHLVILRDRHCVFPWCACDAKSCDLDHIEPYLDGPGAPPGQTRPHNLAPLCRHHHRAKTLHGWTYRRLPDGSYRWKDPHGHTYLVTENGTTNLD